MTRVSAMAADARRRWSETREPTLVVTCTGIEITVPTIRFPSSDGLTWEFQCLPFRDVSLTAYGHAYQFSAAQVLWFYPESWLLLKVKVLDTFLPDRQTLWDIEVIPKDANQSATFRRGPWLAVCTHHFEPLAFQQIKTFPRGWAASRWAAGKLPPTLRSVLSKQAEHRRELRRMEAYSWD